MRCTIIKVWDIHMTSLPSLFFTLSEEGEEKKDPKMLTSISQFQY